MAAAITATVNKRERNGNRRVVEATLTWSGTYTTGGDSIAPGLFGLKHITDFAVVGRVGTANHGDQVTLTGATDAPKLKVVRGGSEVANATAVTDVVRVRVTGY